MVADNIKMGGTLALRRCPHCQIAKPLMSFCPLGHKTSGENALWAAYVCSSCNNVVTAKGQIINGRIYVDETYPRAESVKGELPEPARNYLEQAHRTLGDAPDAAAMVASSSVDAMLKSKGFKGEGFKGKEETLHQRIDQAVKDRVLTEDMGEWAHHVRFVSNYPRHADDKDPHVSPEQARIVVDFADALGEFLFVLPSRAEKAIRASKETKEEPPLVASSIIEVAKPQPLVGEPP